MLVPKRRFCAEVHVCGCNAAQLLLPLLLPLPLPPPLLLPLPPAAAAAADTLLLSWR